MIADHDTNFVFVADTLERRFPAIYGGLKTILGQHGIPFRTIPGTRDVWCRDYMPVQVAEDRFVQFRYTPDYLTGKYRHLRADGEIGPLLPFIKNCVKSEIVLNGGNIVRRGNSAIVTDKIFEENPRIEKLELKDQIKRTLRVEKLIVIRQEPFDPIGHADGMVRWIDDQTVVVNNYRRIDYAYHACIFRTLRLNQLRIIEIPYYPQESNSRDIPSAFGNWANFLKIGRVVVLPMFGVEMDRKVLKIFRERRSDLDVIGLDCQDLARDGGLLNCITWQIQNFVNPLA